MTTCVRSTHLRAPRLLTNSFNTAARCDSGKTSREQDATTVITHQPKMDAEKDAVPALLAHGDVQAEDKPSFLKGVKLHLLTAGYEPRAIVMPDAA